MAEENDAAADNAAGQTGQDGQQTDDSSQQQSAADVDASGTDGSSDDSVSRAELNKVIGERQAAKERARLADTAIADMQTKLDAMPDPEALKAFQDWKADDNAQARDKAMKDGDVEAIEKGVREPLLAQIESLKTTLTNRNAQLSSVLRGQALREAADEGGAHSPRQIVELLRNRVRMVEQADGNFAPEFLDADGQPAYDGASQRITDAKVFVGMYLALPENANLVKSKITTGSGARPAGGQQATGDDGMPTTVAEYNALDPDKKAEAMAKLGPEGMKRLIGAGEEVIPNTL